MLLYRAYVSLNFSREKKVEVFAHIEEGHANATCRSSKEKQTHLTSVALVTEKRHHLVT